MKRLSFITLLSLLSFFSFSQNDSNIDADRFRFGGGLEFGISSDIKYFSISPVVGYFVTDKLLSGAGTIYSSGKFGDYNYQVYGGKIFSNYYVLERLFAIGEITPLNHEARINTNPAGGSDRVWSTAVNVGAGFTLNGDYFARGVFISALYDINHSPSSLNLSPLTFNFGILF